MCFEEWNMNKQLAKVLNISFLVIYKINQTEEGAVRAVNWGAMNRMQCQHKIVTLGAS